MEGIPLTRNAPSTPARVVEETIVRYRVEFGPIDQFAPMLGVRGPDGGTVAALSFLIPEEGRRITFALDPEVIEFLQMNLAGSGLVIAKQLPPL